VRHPTLGVAVVGAAADHWSGTAHLPAIEALDTLDLRWLVTSNIDSARAASTRFGTDATHELKRVLDDDTVDLVAVTVKVPNHAEIASAAIEAGKHVYCEWPLAIDPRQARELATLSATHAERLHVTGLQGRYSPELREAKTLLVSGRIGKPLTASLRLFLPLGLVPRPAHRAHLRHRAVAGNVLTIHGGHALDMLGTMLGSADVTAARLWTAVPEFVVAETGERLPRDAPDNLIAMLEYGEVVVAAHISHTGARQAYELEILGSRGTLRLTSNDQPQCSKLSLSITDLDPGTTEIIEPSLPAERNIALPETHLGYNVAAAYAALADAVATGRRDPLLPVFSEAVVLHDLLNAIASKGRAGEHETDH
jgi:predicted dehydrogenase